MEQEWGAVYKKHVNPSTRFKDYFRKIYDSVTAFGGQKLFGRPVTLDDVPVSLMLICSALDKSGEELSRGCKKRITR